MSEKKAKEKRKIVGNISKYEPGWCEECHADVCPCVIEHIRLQENAMVVAKQAITSLDAMLHKKILEYEKAGKDRDEFKMRLKGKQQGEIEDKMKAIDASVSRFSLRNKIALIRGG